MRRNHLGVIRRAVNAGHPDAERLRKKWFPRTTKAAAGNAETLQGGIPLRGQGARRFTLAD